MAKYRDDLQGAQLRVNTLEAKIKEKEAELSERDAALGARDAEIDELRNELERAKRDLPGGAPAAGSGRSKRGILIGASVALGCAAAAGALVMVRTSAPKSAPASAVSVTAQSPKAVVSEQPASNQPAAARRAAAILWPNLAY